MKVTHTRKKARKVNDPMALTYENIMDINYFRRILPFLTFEEKETIPDIPHLTTDDDWKYILNQQGVVRLQPKQVWGSNGIPFYMFDKISRGMDRLKELNLPIWLLAVSKEAQALMRAIASFVQSATRNTAYKYIADYGIFNVGLNAKGWAPHRDRDESKNALDSDGNPTYITAWMPITNATTLNSCLYFVPRIYDPTFEKDGRKSYMEVLFERDYAGFQNIVALPVNAGGLLSFSSRTVHWGSSPLPPLKGEKRQHSDRKAISVAVATDKFEKQPFIREGATEYPTFLEAVILASSTSLRYNHNIKLSADHKKCFKRVVKENMELFVKEFRANHSDLV